MNDTNLPLRTKLIASDVRQILDAALCPQGTGDAALLARVKERVLTAVVSKTSVLHSTVRAGAGEWEPVSVGLERKLLWETADAISCLLRLAPGAVVAGHTHLMDEECIVLEGSLRIGCDLTLHAGDFHVGVRGVAHELATTEAGAVVFLRSAKPRLELLG